MNGRLVLLAILAVLALLAYGQAAAVKVILAGKGWSLAGKDLKPDETVPANAPIAGAQNESSDLVLNCGTEIGWLSYRSPPAARISRA